MPDILPGQLIQVTGVSPKRIDGKYWVQTVKHSLSSSGYSTNLTVIQNSTLLYEGLRGTFKSLNPNPNTLPSASSPDRALALNTSEPTVPVIPDVQTGVA